MSLSPGTTLGHYTIRERLGTGGMGEVYLAVDSRLGRLVALRVLPPPFSDPDQRARFHREARAAAALNHPNIAVLYETGEEAGRAFLAMELVAGETLRAKLERGPLPVEEARGYATQIADALAALHEKEILFRDLKPDNVMIQPDGRVKLLDAGVTRAMFVERPGPLFPASAESGVVLGTPAYMSPELARGIPVGPASDLFSFGVVLYEMLAGRRPFDGNNLAETLARIISVDPPPIPDVPAALERLVRLCLQKDPAERPNSARAVAAMLAEPWPVPTPKPQAPAPGRVVAVAGLVTAVAAALGLSAAMGAMFVTEPRPASWRPPEFLIAPPTRALGPLDVAVTPVPTCAAPPRCTIAFEARVLDAGARSLNYSWSGCAGGSAAAVTCQVEGADIATASVSVRVAATGETARVSASATSQAVSVFYATDRRRSANATVVQYSGRRNDDVPDARAVNYGVATVSIPPVHEIGAIERPIRVWRYQAPADPNRHFVLLDGAERTEAGFFRDLADRVSAADRKEAFIFVHGFRVDFDDAVLRTAQLHADLGFGGVPILYSWPSAGRVAAYDADYDSARWARPHFARFLDDVARRSGAATLYIIAHSMGAWATLNALEALTPDAGAPGAPRFREVVLAAPDVDAGVFRQLAAAIKSSATRVTLYAASQDRALKASKALRAGYPRAGEAGDNLLVVSEVDTVDSSAVVDEDTDILDHSYYGDARSVLADIAVLLRHGDPPRSRFGLVTKRKGALDYWAFAPSAIPLWVIRWALRIVIALMLAPIGYLGWLLIRTLLRLWRARVA